MSTFTTTPEELSAQARRQLRFVLISGCLGSTIEFYDFLVYGTAAALVFGTVFFSGVSPAVGTVLSFLTLAIGYAARAVGGIVFGHFGDRLGRKRMLIITLLSMGIASALIGLLPTTAAIGVAAPILLTVLRMLQGISVGGERGGSALMALETAHQSRRGLATATVTCGGPIGAFLAAVVMGLFSLLPHDAFLSWGWRIPFLISIVLVAVSLWARLRVEESPLFQRAIEAEAQTQKAGSAPLARMFRFPRPLILGFLAAVGILAFQTMLAAFGASWAEGNGADPTVILFAGAAGSLVNIGTQFGFGRLSDAIGRKPVLIIGFVAGILFFWPMLLLMASADPLLIFIANIVGYGLVVGALLAVLDAFLGEQFPTRVRYTGLSLSYQLGTTVAGFGPVVAASLLAAFGPRNATPVGILITAVMIVGFLAVLATREPGKNDLAADRPAARR